MVKRLNFFGKLLHAFTAFFPLYVYWAYFFFNNVESFIFQEILQRDTIIFILLSFLSVVSILVFYLILVKKNRTADRELNIKSSSKISGHFKYIIGSLSPFALFIAEFLQNNQISKISTVIGTIFFVALGLILIFKDEDGILYNLFYLPYNMLTVQTKDGKQAIIISRKESLSNYVKVNQLDKKVFKEWN